MQAQTSNEPGISCGVCQKVLKNIELLEEHCKIHLTYEINSVQNDKPQLGKKEQTKYQCMFCALSFSQPGELKKHNSECMKQKHRNKKPDKSLALKTCANSNRNEKEFLCEFCGHAFARKDNFLVHLRIHTGEKPYPCYYCSRAFNQLSALKTHLKGHPGKQFYICTPCGKCFDIENEINRHIRSHMEEDEKLAKLRGEQTAD